jgi:hypothetical protein|tara:strand:- start:884 stop:1834 length:951 start_codon:yes stop_codon:yes gene_type:complete
MSIKLSDIRTEVKANLKSSLIAQNRIDLWANFAHLELWRSLDPEYGKETTTFTTVSAQRQYNIEASINKILSVVDQTGSIRLSQLSETEIETFDPELNDSGSPNFYSLFGISYIQNQPSSASAITVVSDDNTDTTQTIQIIGTAGGVEVAENLTMNGTVNVVGSTSFTSLRRISKSATTAGTITATSNAAAVTNVTIPARLLFLEMQPIRLWPVPSSARTILVRYIRNAVPLRDGDDIPDLPENWHSTLLQLTLAYGHEFLYEFDVATQKRGMVAQNIRDLVSDQSHKRDFAPVIGKTTLVPKPLGRLPSNFGILR